MKSVLCTKEFISGLEKFSRSRSTITAKLAAFIDFRETHPDRQAFNPDDTYYATGTPLIGFRHVHLHHGKCIVVYKTTASSLLLLAMCDHAAEDSPKALANYLNRLAGEDMVSFAPQNEAGIGRERELIAVIKSEVFEMIASDPEIVQKSLRGDPTLLDYLTGHARASAIITAFGGHDGFSSFLRKALADYGIREGLRDWINIINETASLTFREECRGSYAGQIDSTLKAIRGEITVGTIDYSVFDGNPQIQMIKVDPIYRRQGVASALLNKLQTLHPKAEIDWGMLSGEGAALYGATPFQVVGDPEVSDKLSKLAAVKSKLAEYKRLNAEFEKGRHSEMARTLFLSRVADWNDLHDEQSTLEDELHQRKPEKKIIRTTP